MPRILPIVLCALLALPAGAAAQSTAPPGNAGIDEYLETVPSGSGNKSVVPKRGSRDGLSPSTVKALEAQGADGKLAAELAASTAPATSAKPSASGSGSGGNGSAPGVKLRDEPAQSPITAVVDAVTGASGDGGMGLLLPILLIGTSAAVLAAALARRRAAE
jgi:hypothetical protein